MSGTNTVGEGSTTRREAAVPDPVVSDAAVAVPASHSAVSSASAALPAVSSKRHGGGGKKKKRKMLQKTKAAKRRSNAKPERDLPTGVYKTSSGKFASVMWCRGKGQYIGSFDTSEQASAAYEAANKKRPKAKRSKKRKLPEGVYRTSSGKFASQTKWGDKFRRHIGTFDTAEQASAAVTSARKDLEDANLSALSEVEADSLFDAAMKKAVEASGGIISKRQRKATIEPVSQGVVRRSSRAKIRVDPKTTSVSKEDLPQGVRKTESGKFRADIDWGGTYRYIGTFGTPEKASVAYVSVTNDLEGVKLSTLSADEVNALFRAAKKKAVGGSSSRNLGRRVAAPDPVGSSSEAAPDLKKKKKRKLKSAKPAAKKKSKATSKRDLPRGVYKSSSGRFESKIRFGGKTRGVGTFDTPEQASAAFMLVKKDLADANESTFGADEVDAVFYEAKKKAVTALSGVVRGATSVKKIPRPSFERDLHRCIRKKSSGKYESYTCTYWGGMIRLIGTFDSFEDASAAYKSVQKDLDNASFMALGADEFENIFVAAKNKALESFGGILSI